MKGLETLDYLAVVAYLAVTMWIVKRSSQQQSDTDEFFLGGRSMPWLAVGLSIMATLLSTNTYLGAPGEMIKYGPAYVFGFLAYPIPILIVTTLWIPFFMRMRMTSAYEYLERRFDYRARLVGGVLFLGLRLGWMSMVVYTASMAMVAMVPKPLQYLADCVGAPHPIYPVILAVGLASTVYASLGGMRAVIWTDVLQAVMLFGGVVLIIGYVWIMQGTGVTAWWTRIVADSASPPQVEWFTWDVSVRTTVGWTMANIIFWNSLTHCCDQVALQRYFTTSSLRSARRSFLVSICSSATIGLLLAVAGLALRYFYLENPTQLPSELSPESSADKLMPFFYANQLPAGFGGLILVSFLCDAMQTLVSGVNSIAAIITQDVTDRRTSRVKLDKMKLARWTTISVGLVSTLLAIVAASIAMNLGKTIFDMLPRMFNMFLGPLAVMFIVGMFSRRATPRVILVTVAITQAFSSLWSWWSEVPAALNRLGMTHGAEAFTAILGVHADGTPKGPSVMLAVAAPCVFGLVVGAVVSALLGRNEHAGLAYTWREVMKLPVADREVQV